MAINYDFIAYSSKISPTKWIIGMKSIRGEVPLDIVIPDKPTTSDPNTSEIVGVLATQGLERESTDGLELYRYLRQLNPKKKDTFDYNDIVIRNIHRALSTLRINEELRVQINYTERREPYKLFSYQIKLIGIFEKTENDTASNLPPEIVDPNASKQHTPTQNPKSNDDPVGQTIYKTTNTLEKLIVFTQNLQQELKQTKRDLATMADKVEQLENDRRTLREIQNLIQEAFDRISHLETFDTRIHNLEQNQHLLQELQQIFRKFLVAVNQQTHTLLQEHQNNTSTR